MSVYGGPDIITDGLVLHLDAANRKSYPLTGSTIYDLSGNSNDGTFGASTAAPAFSSVNGGYLNFDGSNDYIQTNINPLYANSLTEFSISTWSYIVVSDFDNQLKIICATAVSPVNGGFWIGYDDRNAEHSPIQGISWNTKNSGGYSRGKTANNTVSINGWYNVVITYSSSIGVTCYVNSQESTNRTQSNTGDFFPKNDSLQIGKAPDAAMSASWYLKGGFSNMIVYNRVLSQSEITNNYNALKGRYGL